MAEMEFAARDMSNDTRGWIMCIVSGVACVFGASIICVDFIVRLFPSMSNFRIQESNVFLACSLSLSFGVMLFSSLYSMLPESKQYLTDDGWGEQQAGLVMMGCFIAGFLGIQIVSRLVHQYMPSHVVDCDHTHDETAKEDCDEEAARSASHDRQQSRSGRSRRRARFGSPYTKDLERPANGLRHVNESTPLLEAELNGQQSYKRQVPEPDEMVQTGHTEAPLASRPRTATSATRRQSGLRMPKRVLSFVKDTKNNCDEEGSCFGFTDPCGQECFKHLGSRLALPVHPQKPTMIRTTTGPFYPQSGSVFHGPQEHHRDEQMDPSSPKFRTSRAASREPIQPSIAEDPNQPADHGVHEHAHPHAGGLSHGDHDHHDGYDHDQEHHEHGDGEAHHHHVPTNAFLSIGLQTSIAIALHKFPEGFITYATNHANPQLGFNVFMALFVHNISEGFAMCLPLYMALGSRWKALVWSAILGGLSQPLGAGIAALWFHLARKSHMTPNAVAYACLFAATSGIMVSVALQLFVESLSLNHNRNLCIFFGFLGMAILGLSNAMLTEH